MAVRDPSALVVREVLEDLIESLGADVASRLELLPLDLSSLASVRTAAAVVLARQVPLHLLINNAGTSCFICICLACATDAAGHLPTPDRLCLGIMACPRSRSADGYELQFATNHLGHFLLTNLLLPALKAGAPARIVNVSSLAHTMAPVDFDDIHFERRRYGRWIAYAQSKTANVLFTVELQRRLQLLGISAFAVHPGVILTNLVRHVNAPAATDKAAAPAPPPTDARPARPRRTPPEAMKSVDQGAATTLFAALSPLLNGRGGLYLEDCK